MSDEVVWSIVPSCMTPVAQTAKEAKYVTTAGVVKFAVGESGSIVFTSAITASLPPGQYTMTAQLEREDPTIPNREPGLLGTNIQVRRRSYILGSGVEDVLTIGDLGFPVLGAHGVYSVNSPSPALPNGLSIQEYFYWVQLEIKQASPATAETRNSVIGIQIILTRNE